MKYILGSNESYIIEYEELQRKAYEIEKCYNLLDEKLCECKLIS